ncbi:MAG: hypothetical protein ACYTHM_01560 [Planctomycetota bacterium]|jgi:hypothetical protein
MDFRTTVAWVALAVTASAAAAFAQEPIESGSWPKERKILEALAAKKVDLAFKDAPFKTVVDHLSRAGGPTSASAPPHSTA